MQPRFFHRAGLRAGVVALAVCLAAGGGWQPAGYAAEPGLIASPEAGWAQWRGPRRDGICDEQGLRPTWPEGGPPRLWTVEGMGRGYSAPIVVGDRLYLTGDFEERLEIIALDLAGRELWRATNGLAWRGQYPGSRSSVTYAGGRLFHKNAHGRVAALDPDTGRELWAVETLDQFDGRNITWGLSESLLVDGDRVIATVGGNRALMAAFDVRSGQTVWSSPPLRLGEARTAAHERVATPAGEADSGSYTSPILARLAGRRQLVNCSLRHVFGVDADTGELLWSQPFPTRFSVIAATPVLVGDGVFVTAPDAGGGRFFRVQGGPEGISVERAWVTSLDSGQGGVVHVDGLLFGSWYRSRKGWAAIEAQTGEVRHELPDLAMGPLLYADERFYWLSQEGEMTLVRRDATGMEIVSRFRLVEKRVNDAWAHPVIHQGRLYLRYHDHLHCYDVRAVPFTGPGAESTRP